MFGLKLKMEITLIHILPEAYVTSYDVSNHFPNISRSPLQNRNNMPLNSILHCINIDKGSLSGEKVACSDFL